jgi:phosphoribosylcarboxyaminoimidazole (NCAIR) mutase
LTTLVGSGSGRFRYGSTSSINNFTNWLGTSGFYAIYRERPTASWSSTASQTFDYGNTPVIDTTGSVSGLVNGDVADTNMTVRLASTNAVVAANTRGFYNVGSYVFSRTEAAKALGYQVSSPTLTVNRATLTVTANDFTKTYDGLKFTGGKGVTYSGFATGENATNALSGSVSYGGTAQNVVDASASTYSIIPSGLSASNYTINYVNGALTVNPATLTVRINNDARFVSEGDAVGAYNGASYSGFVAKQTPAVLGGALTISRSSSGPDGNLADANTQAGTYTGVLTGSGLTSTNYNINYVAGHYTIVPADQLLVKMANVSATYGSDPVYSVSSARYYRSSNSTVYDLTSSVVLAGNSFSLNDGAGGNTAFTLGAASPSLSTAGQLNAGAYQVGAASITNTSVNYNNTITVTGALQVNPRSVTAAVTSSVSKSYDGTPAMNGLTLALAGAVTGDAVSASGAGAYASKNAGNPVAYTVSNITLSGADARNYVLTDSVTTQASNTLSGSNGVITAVPLSITANNDSKLYDGNAYSGGNGVVFSGFVNNETGADLSGSLVYGGTSQGATNVGASYTIVPSGYTSTNYTIGYANATLSITPVGLTAIVGTLQGTVNKRYDGTDTATLAAENFLLTGWVSGEGATVTKTTGTYDDRNAGSGKTVTVSLSDSDYAANAGTNLGNYTLPNIISGAVGSISPRPVTVSNTSRSTTYDAVGTYASLASSTTVSATSASTAPSGTGLVGSDALGSVTQTPSGTGVTPTGVAQAGSFSVTPSAAVLSTGLVSNYDFSYAASTHTVDKANLAVTATPSLSGNVFRGTAYTGSYTSNALGSDASAITVTGVATGTHAGTYSSSLAVSGAVLANYNTPVITDANLVISPRPVTVSNTSRSTTYDGATSYASLASGTTVSATSASTAPSGTGLVGSDALGSVTQTPSGTGVTPTGVAQAGSFSVTPSAAVLSTGLASNYDFSYSASTHTVNPADLVVTVTPISGALRGTVSKVYDATRVAILSSDHYLLTGWLGSDGATVTKTTGMYDSASAGTGKTVTVNLNDSDYTANAGTNLSNYRLPGTISGAVGVITKAPLTATGTSALVTYNGANQAVSGFTVSGLQGSDTVASLSTVVASGATGKNAGSYTNAVTVGTETNYTVTAVDGTMVIQKAPLMVRPNDDAKFVTQADVPGYAAASYSGWVGGESPAVLGGTLAIARSSRGPDSNPSGSNALAGSYTGVLTASGLSSGNYAITYQPGNYTVVPADQLLIRLANSSVAYGTVPQEQQQHRGGPDGQCHTHGQYPVAR